MKRMQAGAGTPKQIGQHRGSAAFAALLLAAASAQGASAASPDQDGAVRATSAPPQLRHALLANKLFKRSPRDGASARPEPVAVAQIGQAPIDAVLPGAVQQLRSKFARRRMRLAEAVAADPAAL